MCNTDDSYVDALRCKAAEIELETRNRELLNAENASIPSMRLRPALSVDGNQWCALYGANLHDGVAGFGDSPELAYADFDKAWVTSIKPREGKGTP